MFFYDINESLIKAKRIIDDSRIKMVSFDIFDTLLIRPTLYPKDIFYIANKLTKEKYNESFLDMRIHAEEELGNPYANIYDIWNYIGKKFGWNEAKVDFYRNIEIIIEEDLLYARKQIYELYLYAVKRSKKIIAISDMYLTSDILKKVLWRNGYGHISEVYVSCECKKRKDTGELFAYVLEKEGINSPSSILHIGDNYNSDFKKAKKQGIKAVYIPSNMKIFFDRVNVKKIDKWENIYSDITPRLLLGFGINALFDNDLEEVKRGYLSLKGFSDIILFPMLMKIMLFIINDNHMNNYTQVSFAARDGYLPYQMYQIISRYLKNFKRAIYFDASRQAYSCIIEKSIYDKLNSRKITNDYTLEDYINSMIIDDKTKEKILGNITDQQKELKVLKNKKAIIDILNRNRNLILRDRDYQKKAATMYYNEIFNTKSEREIIFDCGYSGSISIALTTALNKKKYFDKIYIWENKKNRELDQENGTITYALFGMNRPAWMDELMECCLSPLKGGCKGFYIEDGMVKLKYENMLINSDMVRDIQDIQERCLAHTKLFMDIFSKYMSLLKWDFLDVFVSIAKYFFVNSGNKNEKIFCNFMIYDSFSAHKQSIALSHKIHDINNTLYCGRIKKCVRKVKNKICLLLKKVNLKVNQLNIML